MTYLGETISELPDNILASSKQVIQLLHGLFGEEEGALRGLGRAGGWDQPSIHCPRKTCGDFSCYEPSGCADRVAKCLFFRVKEMWVKARLPTIQDKLALEKLKKLQNEFKLHCKKKHSEPFVAVLAKTFDLAPKKYREIVMASVEEESEQIRIIQILDNYVGPDATRYSFK